MHDVTHLAHVHLKRTLISHTFHSLACRFAFLHLLFHFISKQVAMLLYSLLILQLIQMISQFVSIYSFSNLLHIYNYSHIAQLHAPMQCRQLYSYNFEMSANFYSCMNIILKLNCVASIYYARTWHFMQFFQYHTNYITVQ